VPFVYILRCGDGTFYTGATTDLDRRLDQHRRGAGARYTRGRGPLELVYREEKASLGEALSREAEIKKLRRSRKEELIRDFMDRKNFLQG
jgi:predicted GIY-YIG superfamily endonuclease